jgi:UDP-N-acetylmuramyl pentapeptide synthase
MNPLTLSQIAQFAGASLSSGDGTVVIDKVSTDSRTIKPGELFVALRGENFAGHDFIEAGAKAGAAGALVDVNWAGKFRTISHFCVRPIRCKPTRRWQPITGGRSR